MRWLLLALVLGSAADTRAHAVQVGSEPVDGAVVEHAPASVLVRFNEAVTPTAVRLFNAAGAPVPAKAESIGLGDMFRVTLPTDLAPGRYVLSYRVTSADAHPVAGAIAFVVGTGAVVTSAAGGSLPGDDGAGTRVALRVVHDASWMMALGAALYLLLVAPFPRARHVVIVASVVHTVVALAGVGLHGMVLGGDTSLLDAATWSAGVRSARGASALLSTLGALLVSIGAATGRARDAPLAGYTIHARSRWWFVSGIAALTASALASGHVATATPRTLAGAAMAMHVLGAAFWCASLVALMLMFARAPISTSMRAVRRFSAIAIIAIPTFLFAGTIVASLELESAQDLWSTAYGRFLALKGALALALLAIASSNRWRWMPRATAGEVSALTTLRRNFGLELLLLAGAVAVAAWLAQTPPSRALPPSTSVHLVVAQGDGRARLTLEPGWPGTNAITVQFESPTGTRLDPAEVRLEFAQVAADVGPIERTATRLAPGVFSWRGPDLALAGVWAIAVHARVGDFDQVTFRTEVTLPSHATSNRAP